MYLQRVIVCRPTFGFMLAYLGLTTLAGPKHRKEDELPRSGSCCLCESFFVMGVMDEGFFWYPLTRVVLDKAGVCVCVCWQNCCLLTCFAFGLNSGVLCSSAPLKLWPYGAIQICLLSLLLLWTMIAFKTSHCLETSRWNGALIWCSVLASIVLQ